MSTEPNNNQQPAVENKGIQTRYFTDRRETYIPPEFNNGKAKLEIVDNAGNKSEYEGNQAIVNATGMADKDKEALMRKNPYTYIANKRGLQDYRNTLSYNLGETARNFINDQTPGFFSKSFNTPFTATTAGAAIGAGSGALLSWLGRKAGLLDTKSDPLIPGIIGALLGGGIGYFSNKHNILRKEGSFIIKKASMYSDPRNFVLEKLQRSTDLSLADKAMLANKVRNMDRFSASELEKLVRASLGIGVGAIIANYFGAGTLGTILGGIFGSSLFQ